MLIFAAPVLLVSVLLIRYCSRPMELPTEFVDSVKQILRSCWGFVVKGDSSWLACMFALVKPTVYFAPPLFVVVWSLPLDSGEPPSTTIRRVLQPVSLHVGFDKARFDQNDELSQYGVTLGPARRPALRVALVALDERVQLGAEPVTIGLHRFASDDGLRDLTSHKSASRNPGQQTFRPKRPPRHCRIWLGNLRA